jgi:hypothetical protein
MTLDFGLNIPRFLASILMHNAPKERGDSDLTDEPIDRSSYSPPNTGWNSSLLETFIMGRTGCGPIACMFFILFYL